jgi:hypothetical protein
MAIGWNWNIMKVPQELLPLDGPPRRESGMCDGVRVEQLGAIYCSMQATKHSQPEGPRWGAR